MPIVLALLLTFVVSGCGTMHESYSYFHVKSDVFDPKPIANLMFKVSQRPCGPGTAVAQVDAKVTKKTNRTGGVRTEYDYIRKCSL